MTVVATRPSAPAFSPLDTPSSWVRVVDDIDPPDRAYLTGPGWRVVEQDVTRPGELRPLVHVFGPV